MAVFHGGPRPVWVSLGVQYCGYQYLTTVAVAAARSDVDIAARSGRYFVHQILH